MASPSKSKGNRLEYLLVKRAQDAGLEAKRAYGSNGKSLGFTDDVDVLIGDIKVQAKARKAVASFMKPPPGADVTVLQEIRKGHTEEPLVVMPLKMFLELLS